MNQNDSKKELAKKEKRLKEQIKNEVIRKGLFSTQTAYRQNTSGMTLKTSKETQISIPAPHKGFIWGEQREARESKDVAFI